ncbi:MAG TPA: hypothetical protein GX392_02015 [Clostridiales bacterium]|nr:hypothetical protein [Clostridiales bacterium]
MIKRSQTGIILILALAILLVGCTNEKTHDKANKTLNKDEIEVSDDITHEEETNEEEIDKKTSKLNQEDNRVIIEEDYNGRVNNDGTFIFEENYDLDGTIYATYYRVDSEGNILNVYDDEIFQMHKFNDAGQSIVEIERKSECPGESDLVSMKGILDIDGNWLVEQATDILSFYDSFYAVFQEQFDDYGSIGYKLSIINNQGKTLLELPISSAELEAQDLSKESIFPSEGIYFSSEFFSHGDKIITYEGDVIELDFNIKDLNLMDDDMDDDIDDESVDFVYRAPNYIGIEKK